MKALPYLLALLLVAALFWLATTTLLPTATPSACESYADACGVAR